MNLLRIALGNILNKPLNTTLSVVMLAFGVGIISLLLLVEEQLNEKFNRNIKDIDFVLGASGSPLQLILANVYHVDAPTGNIKVEDARKIVKDINVAEAIPLAYGDNYENWRIVGTNEKYPKHYGVELAEGNAFEKAFEVNLGSEVARNTGLKVGSRFVSVHGFDKDAESGDAHHHDIEFTVTGIYKESGSAIDNLILTPVQSVWLVHEHDHEEADSHVHAESDTTHTHAEDGHAHDHGHDHDHAHDHDHDHAEVPAAEKSYEELAAEPGREVTAYLLKKRNRGAAGQLTKKVKGTGMQLANPALEANRLNQGFGVGMDAMSAIAVLIMALSFLSVFISLYNSLRERKYELALMRTMGGTRRTLFSLILLEGLSLTLLGILVGLILSRIGLMVLSYVVERNFHYSISSIGLSAGELILIGITLTVGIVASLLPAVKAIRIDISKTLSNA